MKSLYSPLGKLKIVADYDVSYYLSCGYTEPGATGTAKAIEPEYRTQKAKGIKALSATGYNVPNYTVYGIESFTNPVNSEGQIALFPDPKHYENLVDKFVRPCPMVPRHGFVDSRPVRSIEDAQKIVEETLAVEEKAELVVMPFIEANYSAIWTTGKLIIGPSNDGATGGHGSKVIPVLGIPTNKPYQWEQALQLASISEAPYLELLWTKKYEYDDSYKSYFVQLRNGPKLPESVDFIPAEIEVKEVVEATGDLLEWETKAKKFSLGTVIYHPGGSLASHYAVHAVLNNIPVLVSREPKVGERLKPNADVTPANVKQIKAGFLLGCQTDITYQQAALVMLVGCHSTSLWLGKNDLMLGFALGCAYRLIITAALGEARHKPGNKKPKKASRNAVYNGVWNKILQQSTRTRYMKALDSFENDRWNGSYGGKKWLDFARFAGLIFNQILEENVTEALTLFNQAVHAAHNSGWAFDKFLSNDMLDETANNPAYTLVKCAPEFYKIQVEGENLNNDSDWYKYKKPFKIELPKEELRDKKALKLAEADENEEIKEESEPNDCGDCGACDCAVCNPDDDKCGSHGCNYCYPDGCSRTRNCIQCGPKPKAVVEIANVTEAQAVFSVGKLKVQFKQGDKPHQTQYFDIPNEKKEFVKNLLEKSPFKNKSYISSLQYTVGEPNHCGYWFFGGSGISGFSNCHKHDNGYVRIPEKMLTSKVFQGNDSSENRLIFHEPFKG